MKYFHIKCDSNYCGIYDERIIEDENKTEQEVLIYMDEWWREEALDYMTIEDDEDDYEFYTSVEEITKEEYEKLRDENAIPEMGI